MGHGIAMQALGGLALLAFGCSGGDILLSTGNTGGAGGGPAGEEIVGGAGLGGKPLPLGRSGAANGGDSSIGGGDTSSGGDNSVGGTYFGGSGGGSAGDDSVAGAGGAPEPGPEHGGWLAYDLDLTSVTGERQIQVLRADGSCHRPLVFATDQGKTAKQPAFSADGKQLAFAADSSGIFQIYVMDLASGERTQITSEAQGATYPSWSPNGKSIAFVSGDTEDTYDPYGEHVTSSSLMLVDTTTLQTSALTTAKQPAYTSSAFATDNLLLVGNSVGMTGIHTDTLTQYDVLTGGILDPASPSISPDGSRYAYSFSCNAGKQLFLARVDGSTGETCSQATPLAANSDGLITASWGPNGYIAAETSHHDIVLVPSDGSLGIKVLVNNYQPERNPAFAPASVALDCTE